MDPRGSDVEAGQNRDTSEAGTQKVLAVLQGASRSVGDPDLALAELLSDLLIASDGEIQSALARLVADADRN
jgi:hypothetical protein